MVSPSAFSQSAAETGFNSSRVLSTDAAHCDELEREYTAELTAVRTDGACPCFDEERVLSRLRQRTCRRACTRYPSSYPSQLLRDEHGDKTSSRPAATPDGDRLVVSS